MVSTHIGQQPTLAKEAADHNPESPEHHNPSTSGACNCDSHVKASDLISVEEAAQRIQTTVCPVSETEVVTLGSSLNRIIHSSLSSRYPIPHFDNSAMDGFAVRCGDLSGDGPWCLPVLKTIAAGDALEEGESLLAKGAVRILTGALVPDGFDAVIMQEACEYNDKLVCFDHRPVPGQNIRSKGSDMAAGELLISAGSKIKPQDIGLLATHGFAEVKMFRKPKIAVFSTGDELVEPGEQLMSGQLHDTNRPLIMSFCQSLGAEVTDLGIVPDSRSLTEAAIRKCSEGYDLVLTSGAVSVGDRDFVKEALHSGGGNTEFWRVAIKPGKPLLFGTIGNAVFAGLPGNPLAVFVALHVFVKPLIEKLGGQNLVQSPPQKAVSGCDISRRPGRTEYIPAKTTKSGSDHMPAIRRLGNGSSGSLSSLVEAEGFMIVPADVSRVRTGDNVLWLPLW